MMKVGIIFIGTGKYINFFPKYYESFEKNLFQNSEKKYFCFTDADFDGDVPSNIEVIPTKHEPWPMPTLKRFHTILSKSDSYKNFDYLLYFDADIIANEKIDESEILTDSNYIGVHHPGFFGKNPKIFPYEKRNISEAYLENGTVYWQGCVWGGKTESVIELCQVISNRVDKDLNKNLIAEWHDESHINKFFSERIDQVHTLGTEYAFPEVYDSDPDKKNNYPNIDPSKRKLIHLKKNNSILQS